MFSILFFFPSNVKKLTFTNLPEDVSKNVFCVHLFVEVLLMVRAVTTKTVKYTSWAFVKILSILG